ncbi:MAG: hypothetical protein JSV88_20720 [Candidatus Aminicenantes bacterium]|nr:MAG: hypothetical protein JSV88_20720 [Candidatus Aminicenantes bacterium]
MIKIRLKLKDILGELAYFIKDNEDLRQKIYFTAENEREWEVSLNDDFNISADLSTISPLTIEKIADQIKNVVKGVK